MDPAGLLPGSASIARRLGNPRPPRSEYTRSRVRCPERDGRWRLSASVRFQLRIGPMANEVLVAQILGRWVRPLPFA